MRIVEVCARYYPSVGGIQTHVQQISERLARKGHYVEVLTTDPTGKLRVHEELNGVSVTRLKSWAPNDIFFLSHSLLRSLNHKRADIVHAHGYRSFPMLAAALARTRNRAHLVATTHLGFSKIGNLPYKFLYNPTIGRLIFERSDRIIVVSPVELKLLPELARVKEKVLCIPNGIDLETISRYRNSRSSIGESGHPLTIIYVGRFEEKKGIRPLVNAFSRLGMGVSTRLLLIGDRQLGPELTGLVHELRLKNVIVRTRVSQDELYRSYAESDIFVLPSEFEGDSIALKEAMAFGLVPVATDVGGNRFLIRQGVNGFLIRHPVDVEELCTTIQTIFGDRKLRTDIGTNAVSTSRSYDINEVTNKLQSLYESSTAV